MKFTPDRSHESEDHFIDYLIHDLRKPIFSYGFDRFKTDLWELTKSVSQSFDDDEPIQDFTKLFKAIDELIEGAWQFLELRKRYQFDHSALHTKYTKNPFRQFEEHRDSKEDIKYSFKYHFLGTLNVLSTEEIRNFSIVIEHFFSKTGVIEWKRKMIKWSEYAGKSESIIDYGWDDKPLLTFQNLIKLIEAGYDQWQDLQWKWPLNYNLFQKRAHLILEMEPDDEGHFSPLQEINHIFNKYNATMLKREFKEWVDYAINQEKVWDKGDPADLIVLYYDLMRLLEAGKLLILFDEIPSEWINPNQFRPFHMPKTEENPMEYVIINASKIEGKYLALQLSSIFDKFSIRIKRLILKDMLIAALSSEKGPNFNISHQDRICQIIEILYLINLEVCSRIIKNN